MHEARNDNKLKKIEQTTSFEEAKIHFEEQNVSSIDCTYKRIELTDDEFDELRSNFHCEFDYLKAIGCNLLHSSFDKERIREILSKWYNQREHTNEFTLDAFVDRYYTFEDTNKWFYSIVNHIEDISIRDEWLNKFKNWSVDEIIKLDLNLDSDCFTLTNIDLTDYSLFGGIGININMFLNDLKRVLIVINGSKQVFILKEVDGETNRGKFGFLNIREFKNRMSEINRIAVV